MDHWQLSLCEARYAIYKLPCKLPPRDADALERQRREMHFTVLMESDAETTLIASEGCRIEAREREEGWRRLTIEGVLPFAEHGILLKVLAPLAEAGISVLVCSAFSTDHVFVKDECLPAALGALRQAGLGIKEAVA